MLASQTHLDWHRVWLCSPLLGVPRWSGLCNRSVLAAAWGKSCWIGLYSCTCQLSSMTSFSSLKWPQKQARKQNHEHKASQTSRRACRCFFVSGSSDAGSAHAMWGCFSRREHGCPFHTSTSSQRHVLVGRGLNCFSWRERLTPCPSSCERRKHWWAAWVVSAKGWICKSDGCVMATPRNSAYFLQLLQSFFIKERLFIICSNCRKYVTIGLLIIFFFCIGLLLQLTCWHKSHYPMTSGNNKKMLSGTKESCPSWGKHLSTSVQITWSLFWQLKSAGIIAVLQVLSQLQRLISYKCSSQTWPNTGLLELGKGSQYFSHSRCIL